MSIGRVSVTQMQGAIEPTCSQAQNLVSDWVWVLDWLCLSCTSSFDNRDRLSLNSPSRMLPGVRSLWVPETTFDEISFPELFYGLTRCLGSLFMKTRAVDLTGFYDVLKGTGGPIYVLVDISVSPLDVPVSVILLMIDTHRLGTAHHQCLLSIKSHPAFRLRLFPLAVSGSWDSGDDKMPKGSPDRATQHGSLIHVCMQLYNVASLAP